MNSVKINFEDFFLPITVPNTYEYLYKGTMKNDLKEIIFQELWTNFKKKKDSRSHVHVYRLLDIDKEKIVKLVTSRLGPFLINEYFLENDYVIKNPYYQDYIDLISDSDVIKHELDIDNKDSHNKTFKNYYSEKEKRFVHNYYDFAFDDFLDKNQKKSYFSKYKILKQSKYNLAKVLIFVPEK